MHPKYAPVGDLRPAASAAINPAYTPAEQPDAADEQAYAHLNAPLPAGAIARLGSARMIVGGQWTAAMAFSPDGRFLAAGGEESACTIWDVATGNLARALPGHGEVTSLAYSPDGTLLAVAGNEAVSLWNPATGARVGKISVNAMPRAVAFSGDGKQIAVGEYHAVTLWDVASRKLLRRSGGDDRPAPGDETDHFQSVAISPDGKWLAAGSYAEVPTKDVENNGVLGAYVHGVDTTSVRRMHLWDLAGGKHVRMWESPSSMDVAFSADSTRVIGIAGAEQVVAWGVATGKEVSRLEIGSEVQSFAVMPDGKLLAVLVGERTATGNEIQMWDLEGKRVVGTMPVKSRDRAFAFSHDGKLIAKSGAESMLEVTVVATGKPVTPLDRHDGWIFSAAFSPDGKSIACSTNSGFRIWSVAEARPITEPEPTHSENGRAWAPRMTYSPDGLSIATTSLVSQSGVAGRGTVEMWSAADTRNKWRRELAGVELKSPLFVEGGKVLAVAGGNGQIHLLDAGDGKTIKTVTPQSEAINSIVASPDGRRLATGGKSGVVRVIDTGTWTVLREVTVPFPATPQMFSSTGKLVGAVCADGTAVVWDVDSGSVVCNQKPPASRRSMGAPRLLFNGSDSPFVLRVDEGDGKNEKDAGVQVWDLTTGKKCGFFAKSVVNGAFDVSRDRSMFVMGSAIDALVIPTPGSSAAPVGKPKVEPLPEVDLFAAITLNRPARVAELLKADPKQVGALDRNGMPALALAVAARNRALVELLIKSGADVNRTFLDGRTALHCASDVEIARMLLDKGAKVDAGSGPIESTALEMFCLGGDPELTRLLLERGANPNRRLFAGESLLDMAVLMKLEDVAAVLRKHGAKGIKLSRQGGRQSLAQT